MENENGILYFKLESEYSGDTTKDCALYGEEVDHNFHFLRGMDIESVEVENEDTPILKLNRFNGEVLSTELPDVTGTFSGQVMDAINELSDKVDELSSITQSAYTEITEATEKLDCLIDAVSSQTEYLFNKTEELDERVTDIESVSAGTRLDTAEEILSGVSDTVGHIAPMAHSHDNLSELDKVNDGDVDAWNQTIIDLCRLSAATPVTIVTSTTQTDILKQYIVYQGGKEIGNIDIPKDLVVTSGEVVKNPTPELIGTYLKLTIANQEEPVYIDVHDLGGEVYTADEQTIHIDDHNVISVMDNVFEPSGASNTVREFVEQNYITSASTIELINSVNERITELSASTVALENTVATLKETIKQELIGEMYSIIKDFFIGTEQEIKVTKDDVNEKLIFGFSDDAIFG